MNPSYLLHPAGLAALADFVAPETLFAFDLDGTLSPIVADYAAAAIDQETRSALLDLATLAKVAVITGRSRDIARTILGFEPHLLIGNHGAEWPGAESRNQQFGQWGKTWAEVLHRELSDLPGIEIEDKGASVTLHYRRVSDVNAALTRIDAAIGQLSPAPKRIGGKFVVNLLPREALTKGEALVTAMDQFGFDRALFIGDDVTDEEVFLLRNPRILGIHIGQDVPTAAPFYLDRQTEMPGLLQALVGMLKGEKV